MKRVIVALSAAALIAATPAAMAMGTSGKTHRYEMHKRHHGASARASTQEMKGSKTGSSGASNSAPGQTTGTSTKRQ